MDRTGSTSTFPASADQFAIKKPYDYNVALGSQAIDSLERAAHFNHMFDAMVNIETYILAGCGLAGGSILTAIASSGSDPTFTTGSNLKIGYGTLTLAVTSNTISATASVPSSFSASPFAAKGFSMAHNIYVTSRFGSAISGIWGNKAWAGAEPFNSMITWPQYFGMVRPVSGRVFEFTLKTLYPHSSAQQVNTFTDQMTIDWSKFTLSITERAGWAGTNYGALYAYGTYSNGVFSPKWSMFSEADSTAKWGIAYIKEFQDITDGYIEFGPIDAPRYNATNLGSGEVYSRFGPMIRQQGTYASCSFYCIAIGDVDSSSSGYTSNHDYGSRSARLLRVKSTDLSAGGNYTNSVVTDLWSSTASCSALWGSNLQLAKGTYKYRLKAVGTTISVEESPDPYQVWTVIASAVDSSAAAIASGNIGLFSQACDGSTERGMDFTGPIIAAKLASGSSQTVEAQFMYLEISPEGNFPMESS